MKWKTNYKGFHIGKQHEEARSMGSGEELVGEEKLNLVEAPGINAP